MIFATISKRLGRAASPLANLAMLAVVFFAVTAFQSRNLLDTDREAAPPLSGITLDGQHYDLAERQGQTVLVYFFAPWCRVCGASADNLVRLRQWRGEAELEIVAVALDWQSAGELEEYRRRHELNIPVVLGTSEIARDWHVYAFPTYYVLDQDLRVARRDLGYSTQLGLWWRSTAVD